MYLDTGKIIKKHRFKVKFCLPVQRVGSLLPNYVFWFFFNLFVSSLL